MFGGKSRMQITTFYLKMLCPLLLQLLHKVDSDKARVVRKKERKDLGGIWAGGQDQNIHIDGKKSPPQAFGWPLIRVTVHITLEMLGAASAAQCRADLGCFYIAV